MSILNEIRIFDYILNIYEFFIWEFLFQVMFIEEGFYVMFDGK